MQGQEEVVEEEDDHEDDHGFFVDEEFEGVEGSKFDSVESGEAIGSAPVVELVVDKKPEEVDRSDSDIGGEQFLDPELDG